MSEAAGPKLEKLFSSALGAVSHALELPVGAGLGLVTLIAIMTVHSVADFLDWSMTEPRNGRTEDTW